MRLVKIGTNKNLKEIPEIDYIRAKYTAFSRKQKFNIVQFCELPKVKLKEFRFYKLDKIQWDSEFILNILSGFPKSKLKLVTKELINQLIDKDEGKWKLKGKQRLIAYIFELAYQAGLLNSHTVYHNNDVKQKEKLKNEQNTSKGTDKKQPSKPRKKTKVPQED